MNARSDTAAARLEITREGRRLTARLRGPATIQTLPGLLPEMPDAKALAGLGEAQISLAGVTTLDTAGAWLVHRLRQLCEEAGARVELTGVEPRTGTLLDTVARNDTASPPPAPQYNPIAQSLVFLGEGFVGALVSAGALLSFLGLVTVTWLGSLTRPGRIRWLAFIGHIERTGLNALPIVGLISFLVGVVLAYQGADQLRRFGAEIFTVNLVGVGVLREMGILLTAIIVAGRSGSAFTAELGTMQVNEEIDAMRTIGMNPVEVLVLPRVFGLFIALPLLTFYADMMGLFGGAVMATLVLDISFVQYLRQLEQAVGLGHFFVGLSKAPVFAVVIAVVGCYEGFKVERTADSVGKQTTKAVVESIFLVIVLDALFSILYSALGI
jgi:phospholipid/cholesterol/gamma-HCH transport system permease protein